MKVASFNGQRLYQARLRAQLTQDDLAYALRDRTTARTTGRSVRRWEAGQTTPHSALIPAIAAAVNVSVDWLFEHDGDDEEESREVKIRSLRAKLILAGRDDLAADLAAIAASVVEHP